MISKILELQFIKALKLFSNSFWKKGDSFKNDVYWLIEQVQTLGTGEDIIQKKIDN